MKMVMHVCVTGHLFGEQKEGQKQVNSCLHIIFSIFTIIAIG